VHIYVLEILEQMDYTSKQKLKSVIKQLIKEYAKTDIATLNSKVKELQDTREFLLQGGYIESGGEADKGLQATIAEVSDALANLYA
jgi:hypothetical protein